MIHRLRNVATRWTGAIAALGLLAALLLSFSAANADSPAACQQSCQSAPATVVVAPSSFKLWPSGAKTLTEVNWSPSGSTGYFDLVNTGASPTPAFALNVTVENHDPAGEALLTSTVYGYVAPGLAPAQTVTVAVPLDYGQCDIYVVVNAGGTGPTVLRTGNPAAC